MHEKEVCIRLSVTSHIEFLQKFQPRLEDRLSVGGSLTGKNEQDDRAKQTADHRAILTKSHQGSCAQC